MRTTLLGLCLLVACGSDARTSTPPPGAPDAASTPTVDAALDAPPDGVEAPRNCGGMAGTTCSASGYCDYPNNTCGAADSVGTCKPRPAACPAIIGHEVCGCDGKVHTSECAAEIDGSDLDAKGGCAKVPGKFACGYQLCDLTTEYCTAEPHAGAAETYTCVTLPTCQGTASCACLAGERCGNACTGDEKVGLTLTCPATP